MKNLYVSQPMRGKTWEEIMQERKKIIAKAEEALKQTLNVINPYETPGRGAEIMDGGVAVLFLGASIKTMADADFVAFGKGWEDARGCRIEHQVCMDYGIPFVEIYSD